MERWTVKQWRDYIVNDAPAGEVWVRSWWPWSQALGDAVADLLAAGDRRTFCPSAVKLDRLAAHLVKRGRVLSTTWLRLGPGCASQAFLQLLALVPELQRAE